MPSRPLLLSTNYTFFFVPVEPNPPCQIRRIYPTLQRSPESPAAFNFLICCNFFSAKPNRTSPNLYTRKSTTVNAEFFLVRRFATFSFLHQEP